MKPSFNFLAILTTTLLLATPGAVLAAGLTPAKDAQPVPLAEVQLVGIDGTKSALTNYKGKVVLVDFWASWCGPCRESFPWMNSIQQQYQSQGLEVIAINLDEEPELAHAFLQQVPAQFRVLLDTEAQLPDAFGLIGMPSSYLIDRSGLIRAQHIGFHASQVADYEQSIKTLLAE